MSSRNADREERVTRLYRRYAPHIAAYALRRAAPDESADIVSETFLVAWRRSDDVPPEPHTLPWLYGVARRVLSNQRRSTRRRGRLARKLSTQFVEHHTPPMPIEDADRLERLGRALSGLPPDDAELLRLVAWEGMSAAQLAEIFEIEPNAARQRLHRARLRLRAVLDADAPPPECGPIDPPAPPAAAPDRSREVQRS